MSMLKRPDICDGDVNATNAIDSDDTSDDDQHFAKWCFDLIEDLMIGVFKISPRAITEIKAILSRIGNDDDVTLLYLTATNERKWIRATEKYNSPIFESVMFGMMEYRIDCDLDRMVYSVLLS